MKTKRVIKRFGSTAAVAEHLGITRQAVEQWGEEPPPLRQFQIERLTADSPDPLRARAPRREARV